MHDPATGGSPPAPATIYGGALGELDQIDQAVYRAIAATPSPSLDFALSRLSSAADHSKLWQMADKGIERAGRSESFVVEQLVPVGLRFYAGLCGWTLARAHARSGDPIAIATYLGRSDQFDRSITDFSERYAEQNEQDYQAFATAIRSGRLEAVEGV